jgi:hypothetical protein
MVRVTGETCEGGVGAILIPAEGGMREIGRQMADSISGPLQN